MLDKLRKYKIVGVKVGECGKLLNEHHFSNIVGGAGPWTLLDHHNPTLVVTGKGDSKC